MAFSFRRGADANSARRLRASSLFLRTFAHSDGPEKKGRRKAFLRGPKLESSGPADSVPGLKASLYHTSPGGWISSSEHP